MLYLDTAALVKLIRREEASDALVDWISQQTGPAAKGGHH